MVYTQSNGYMPRMQSFTAGSEWKKITVPFSALDIDGHDLMGIFLGAWANPGAFSLMIDGIRLE
jgi:hypothetical protein